MLGPRQRIGPLTMERLACATATVLLAALLIWMHLKRPAPSEAFGAPHRSLLVLPAGVTLSNEGFAASRFAVSPDGTQVAFVGVTGRGPMLWLQSLNETSARSIEGSEGAAAPFWSPDSRILGFRRNDRMMKLEVFGSGRVEQLGDMTGTAAWNVGPSGEDLILTSIGAPPGKGIRAWSRQNRVATDLFVAKQDSDEVYALPAPLFDGRHFLFVHGILGDPSTRGLYFGTFGSTEKTRLLSLDPDTDHLNTCYASGYLLIARNQSITARAFDRTTMTVAAAATPIAGPVLTMPRAGAAFSASQNGVLVYEPASRNDHFRLTVYDRNGEALRTLSDDAAYSNVELSPDGSQVAVSVADAATGTRDIWVVDMVRGVRSRVTFDVSEERSASWSVDSKSLVYTSKGLDLYTKTVGTGSETPFLKDGLSKDPRGWSPDGESFVYRVTGVTTRNDLWIRPRDPAQKPSAFLATPFDENYAMFAPDGRWMAYVSDESGRAEVYVTSFPSGKGKWQISTTGGTFPRWRRDGREIVYLAPDGKLIAVAVNGTGASLAITGTEALFQTKPAPGPGTAFDMTADGQRFVVNSVIATTMPPSLIVLYNWPALIRNK
jgi:eukaryotic-like serine/threonine-protein kinase